MFKKSFSAKIKESTRGGAQIEMPFNLKDETGKGRMKVKVKFDGEEYEGSIVSMGGKYIVGIRKDIRKLIGKDIGDFVSVDLVEDNQIREVSIPSDFATLLKNNNLENYFSKLSYTHQKEYVNWIESAKKTETRNRRMNKALIMLEEGKML